MMTGEHESISDKEACDKNNRWWALLAGKASEASEASEKVQSGQGHENPSHNDSGQELSEHAKKTLSELLSNYSKNKVMEDLPKIIQNPNQATQALNFLNNLTHSDFPFLDKSKFYDYRRPIRHLIKHHAKTKWHVDLE